MDGRYGWKTQKIVPHMCGWPTVWVSLLQMDTHQEMLEVEADSAYVLASVDGCRIPLSTTQFSSLFLLFPGFGTADVNCPLCWLPAAGTALESSVAFSQRVPAGRGRRLGTWQARRGWG